MKDASPTRHWKEYFGSRAYQFNSRHFGYIAGKQLRARDSFEALIALLVANFRDGVRHDRKALGALRQTIAGFAKGLRRREPVQNARLSRTYRLNFHSFASPWWLSRRPGELLGFERVDLPPVDDRVAHYFSERERYYPESAATLEF
jgi:hypothetical protein